MKILQAHVRHREVGGAEVMFDESSRLLRARGHEVVVLERDNRTIAGTAGRIGAALSGVYSPAARREVAAILRRERPDVAHFHNLYPLLSPSAVLACREAAVPVVVSLHDYKLVCPTAQYFRDGAPCHRCAGGREYNCVLTNCRDSLPESLAYALRTAIARRAGWIVEGVDRFVACSDFVRDRHVAEGFPPDRVRVIPNFATFPRRMPERSPGAYAAYVGRLSAEKGIATLIDAARIARVPLHIAGSARPEDVPRQLPPGVQLVGRISRAELGGFLGGARFAVVPSIFEEPFGLAAAEAMGHGLPVIASRIGGLEGLVTDGVDGFRVAPGDAAALAERMALLWNDPALAARMGAAARARAVHDFDPGTHCDRLEHLYGELTPRGAAAPALRS